MTKRIILILLFAVLPLLSSAQLSQFFRNSYISLGVNPNFYLYDGGSSLGGGANLAYGKWVLTSFGLRGQLSEQYAKGLTGSHLYTYAHGDLFFDPITALRGRNPSDFWRFYVLVGFGAVHSNAGDNDFMGHAALGVDYRVSHDWRLFAEAGSYVQPSSFDNNNKASELFFLTMGVERDICHNPTRARARIETQNFRNDWFLQVALGANMLNYNGVGEFSDRLRYTMPVLDLGVGKRLNTTWAFRFHTSGLYAKYQMTHPAPYGDPTYSDEYFTYVFLNADLALNVIGLFTQQIPDFSVLPYGGMGVCVQGGHASNFLFGVDGGLMLSYRLPEGNSGIYLDARYVLMPPRFIETGINQGSFSVGIATLSLGYTHNLSKRSF